MSKQHISRLAAIMVAKGIEQVVVSPGSRNAPLIILFGANKGLQMVSVADERSAGFFALGMAMKSGKAVALLCTSGSAVLNYAPAIAEAYYQKVPLLIITADRPVELIDQGDSQTIRQNNIFANYIRKSFNLPVTVSTDNDKWYFDRVVNEAIDRVSYPAKGPVQLNIPLDEPLYDLDITNVSPEVSNIQYVPGETRLDFISLNDFTDKWNDAASKLIIVGQMTPDVKLTGLLKEISEDPTIVILSECTSNFAGTDFINCIDRTLSQIPPAKNTEFRPDILLSIGGAIISKKVKSMLREMKPARHWHINADPDDFHYDTYKSLTATIALKPEDFLEQLLSNKIERKGFITSNGNLNTMNESLISRVDISENNYSKKWKDAFDISLNRHTEFLKDLEFSDLKAYEHIFNSLPSGCSVHLGNSTPARYGQLFDHKSGITFYSNRGTSGIDGCSSTAAGFAFNNKGLTLLITGDIGFFYDSNALWNSNLSEDLRIILINNGGGNIFRIIDGPSGYDVMESFIETRQNFKASGIAENFNITYYKADTEKELIDQLPIFFAPNKSKRPALLEVITDNVISAKALKDYFNYLRKNGKDGIDELSAES